MAEHIMPHATRAEKSYLQLQLDASGQASLPIPPPITI